MKLLKSFPLNRNINGGHLSSLIKTTAKYFVLFILAEIVIFIFHILNISLIAQIMDCFLRLYISMGMILAVFMFLLQENKDAGGIR